jgi:hypothetical protein
MQVVHAKEKLSKGPSLPILAFTDATWTNPKSFAAQTKLRRRPIAGAGAYARTGRKTRSVDAVGQGTATNERPRIVLDVVVCLAIIGLVAGHSPATACGENKQNAVPLGGGGTTGATTQSEFLQQSTEVTRRTCQ